MSETERRRRRRIFWLLLLVIVLGYPVLVFTSTRSGLAVGLQHDVAAERQLLRALNYAGDQLPQGGFGTQSGQPVIAGMDPAVLQQEMGGPSVTAGGQPASAPAIGSPPAPNPAGGGTASAPAGGRSPGPAPPPPPPAPGPPQPGADPDPMQSPNRQRPVQRSSTKRRE